MRLRQFCAVHGDGIRGRRILRRQYTISAAAGSAPATAPSILSLAGRQGRWGELQSFRAGRHVEHDAAPPAVESLQNAVRAHIGSRAGEVHRQTAKRAVRMRGVGVHAPSHRLRWLIEGKRAFRGRSYCDYFSLFSRDSCFRRAFRCGLHPGRRLTLGTRSRCTAAAGIDRPGPTLRLFLARGLRSECVTRAGFACRCVLGTYGHCKNGATRQPDSDVSKSH